VYGLAHSLQITLLGMQVIKVRAMTDARFFSLTNRCLNRAHEVLTRVYALSRSN
jgi:hypothetical protein